MNVLELAEKNTVACNPESAWYLIDKFDVTPAEEFLAKELSA